MRAVSAICYDLKPKAAGAAIRSRPRREDRRKSRADRESAMKHSVVSSADGKRGICSVSPHPPSRAWAQNSPAQPKRRRRQSGLAARPGDRPPHHRQGRGPAAAEDRADRGEPLDDAALHRPGAARAGGLHRDRVRHRPRTSAPACWCCRTATCWWPSRRSATSRCCATRTATARPTGSSATSRA